MISSSSAGRIKKLNGPQMAPRPYVDHPGSDAKPQRRWQDLSQRHIFVPADDWHSGSHVGEAGV